MEAREQYVASGDQLGSTRYQALRHVAFLAALVFGCYFLRLDALSVRGEESRWATVAREMQSSDDWIVPRQQGRPFLSRPPLGSWLMAAAAEICGSWDARAVRLPSVIAVLLTTVLIYGYGRTFLSPLGAFAAAAAYATMGEVLQLGRLGETEAVFTMLLSASLLTWHVLYVRAGATILAWTAGYTLAGLAALAKGPQAPVYFVSVTAIWLALEKRWRDLFGWKHLAGIAAFLLVVGAWLVPFYLRTDLAAVRQIWLGDSTFRFRDMTIAKVVGHALTYPLETLGCTAPWSVLVLPLIGKTFRNQIAHRGEPLRFLLTAILVTYPTCWLTPGGLSRYYMPLYPVIALLAGVVLENGKAIASAPFFFGFARRLRFALGLFAGFTAVLMLCLNWMPLPSQFASLRQPFWIQAVVVAATVPLLVSLRYGTWDRRMLFRFVGVLAVYSGVLYAGPVVHYLAARNGPAAVEVRKLREQLPRDERIASIGPVHHLFAYHFGEPIMYLPIGDEWPPGWQEFAYFCYWWKSDRPRMALPFGSEEVAAISMERDRHRQPATVVVVVRRIATPAQSASSQASDAAGGSIVGGKSAATGWR